MNRTYTPALETAMRTLDDIRIRGGILLVLAPAGTGKSTLLTHYTTTRTPGPWSGPVYLYRTDVVNTPLGLVQALLSNLGTRWHGDTRLGLRCLQAELPVGATLLVDDAHRLALHSLDVLRRLHERTALRLVLAGPLHLPRVLRKKCPELLHRVHGRVMLSNMPTVDVAGFVHTQVRHTDDALSQTLATYSAGNPYWVDEGLRMARLEARERHQRLTPRLVERVFGDGA